MTYGDSLFTGDGWIGQVFADPECTVLLHETDRPYDTAEAAWLVACDEWHALTETRTVEQEAA